MNPAPFPYEMLLKYQPYKWYKVRSSWFPGLAHYEIVFKGTPVKTYNGTLDNLMGIVALLNRAWQVGFKFGWTARSPIQPQKDENGLLPCPLCGKKVHYTPEDHDTCMDGSIQCSACNLAIEICHSPDKHSIHDAIEAWNRRA